MCFFTIILPTCNRPDLLRRAIRSVIDQSFLSLELIIINDSTNNESEDVIKEFINDERITYVKNEANIGAAASRNVGIEYAIGDYVSFLDDDDEFLDSDSLRKVYSKIKENNDNWFVFNRIDSKKNKLTFATEGKENYNWIKDCLFGKKFRGDAVHFINRKFIGPTRNIGAGRAEWMFWFNLAKKGDFAYFDIDIHKGDYLIDGLMMSFVNDKNHLYLKQQFLEILKTPSLYYFLPLAFARYILHPFRSKKFSK